MAVDKGAITDSHVLVLPIEHFPSSLHLSPSTYAEMERYLSALRSCFAAQVQPLPCRPTRICQGKRHVISFLGTVTPGTVTQASDFCQGQADSQCHMPLWKQPTSANHPALDVSPNAAKIEEIVLVMEAQSHCALGAAHAQRCPAWLASKAETGAEGS